MILHGHVQNGVVVLDQGATLPDGTSVRVDAHVDDRALRCVLDALHAR